MRWYGTAYYPEQETREQVEADARTMRELGFNTARLGEFAWAALEPREGVYDFSWLDHALDALHRNGVSVILCTPTACPPIWLVEKHPDILYRDNRGVTRPFGGRRHYCYANPTYRAHSARIADALARRYGADARVIGFQIDNELGQEGTGRCHCPVCVGGFADWLRGRFGDIAAFNREAGTTFWSQTYERFDQVRPPARTIEPCATDTIEIQADNPTVRLEWERYCGAALTAFQDVQAKAIKPHARQPVTTNACGMWTNPNDLYDAFSRLDVAGGDMYPGLRTDDLSTLTAECTFYRGLKRAPFWVLETSSGGGHGVWSKCGIPQPFPGAIRQVALIAAATGADLLAYFQFRSFAAGAEQLEAGVMDVDNVPRRRFAEFQRTSADLAKLRPLLQATAPVNEIAVVYDFPTHWAIRIKPFARSYSYQMHVVRTASVLGQRGHGCDIVGLHTDLSAYKLVILPCAVVLDDATKARLAAYVRGGGNLLATFLTGIKGPRNTAPRASAPAGLTDLFGMSVDEGEPVYREGGEVPLSAEIDLTIDGAAVTARNLHWTESLHPAGAEVIGRYRDTYRAGEAVATRHRAGKGTAWYLGTWLDEEPLAGVLAAIARASGASAAPIRHGRGVEAVRRRGAAGDAWFLFNHRELPSTVTVERPLRDELTGRVLHGEVTLAAKECLALRDSPG